MNRLRYLLIIAITLLVMTTVVATRLYEYIIMLEVPTQALVKAGYQRFRKATNGFNFRYPVGWRYEQQINTDDYINGFFYNQTGEKQLYLESPYSGHEFIFTTKGEMSFFSPTPNGELSQVVLVSSTLINTNDPNSPLIFNLYRPCSTFTSSSCPYLKQGGFLIGVWQRGSTTPVLDINRNESKGGVLFVELSGEPIRENFQIENFLSILKNFRFNNVGDLVNSTSLRSNVYHNYNLRYSFNYPNNFKVNENVDLSYVFMATGTAVDFPDNLFSGTNLSEAKILLGDILPENSDLNCLPNNSISSSTIPVSINGIKYYKSVGAGAAVGNRYDTITYATNRGGNCFNITLFLHSTVLENYADYNRPRPFDRDYIIASFNGILNTFSND